jgi:hypothetical protein
MDLDQVTRGGLSYLPCPTHLGPKTEPIQTAFNTLLASTSQTLAPFLSSLGMHSQMKQSYFIPWPYISLTMTKICPLVVQQL